MKPDERALIAALLDSCGGKAYAPGAALADEIGGRLGIHPNRVHALLEKWEKLGLWDSGVTTRSGWFTPAGIAEFTLLLK
jgi:hypothetical protein